MPEDGVDLQPQSKMINQQEILRLASMFVDAGVDKIRLTGGEVSCHVIFSTTNLPVGCYLLTPFSVPLSARLPQLSFGRS